MPTGTGTRRSGRFQTARLTQDRDTIARRQRQGRRQGLKLLADPFGPLLGKGYRAGKMFEAWRYGDDLAISRIKPQTDPLRPAADPQQHRRARNLNAVTIGEGR
jgi:hypothetical protein